MKNVQVSQKVVTVIGSYVGRTGTVIDVDSVKNRARVHWEEEAVKTWVSFSSIEPTSIPYMIQEGSYNPKTGRISNYKYIKL